MTIRIEHHHYFHIDDSDARALSEIKPLLAHLTAKIMTTLETLNSKLDAAKQAALDERNEVLAALDAIKALIVASDLTAAIAKADEVIASIQAVHTPADDAPAQV